MSWQASQYARDVLEDENCTLPKGARLVLMLLAERAGSKTAVAFGGTWLRTASTLTASSVNRAMHQLGEAGIVAVELRPGRPLIARFPLSTPLAAVGGVANQTPTTSERDPSHYGAVPRALVRAVPGSRRVENHSQPQRSSCAADCPLCEGIGWIEVESATERSAPSSAPCPGYDADIVSAS